MSRRRAFFGRKKTSSELDIIDISFQNSPNGVGGFNGVDFCEGSGLWTIAGERGTERIFHSENGENWVLSTYPNNINHMRFANDGSNSILAARNTGGNRTSIDQINWASITVPNNNYREAVTGGGVWLLFRNDNPARSTDRINWSIIAPGLPFVYFEAQACYDGNYFFKAEGNNGIYRSHDLGLTWAVVKSGSAAEFHTTIDVGNGCILAFARTNLITKSFDGGDTWTTPVTGPLTSQTVGLNARLAFGGGIWIFVNDNPTGDNFYFSKNNGDTWSPSPVAVPQLKWMDIHYSESQKKFIAVADATTPSNVIMEIKLG